MPLTNWKQAFATVALVVICTFSVQQDANAEVSCSATMNDAAFNNIVPWQGSTSTSGSVRVTCSSDFWDWYLGNRKVNACLSIGTGSVSNSWNPRQLGLNGSPTFGLINFQIYDQFGTFVGSPSQPSPILLSNILVPGFGGSSSTVVVPLQFTIPMQSSTSSISSGTYSSNFNGNNAMVTVSPSVSSNSTPSNCSNLTNASGTFPFTVSGTVQPFCQVLTSDPMKFADVAGFGDTQRDAATDIRVQCTNLASYKINLTPSNNSTSGVGALKYVAGGSETVAYSLFQDAGRTIPWGNQTNNNKAGTGNGAVQNQTVYGRVPANLNATPGAYSDSVQVTVTY